MRYSFSNLGHVLFFSVQWSTCATYLYLDWLSYCQHVLIIICFELGFATLIK
jgi:hypothetical protein